MPLEEIFFLTAICGAVIGAGAVGPCGARNTHRERRLSDAGAAPRVQRARYGIHAGPDQGPGAALATQFKDHAG